jgi:murein DD-endopeptidase MepM/ murein hydrolase activator NlpD
MRNIIILFIITIFGILLYAQENADIINDRERWKEYYSDIMPKDTAFEWYLPFRTSDRKKPSTMRTISTFGSPRNSFKAGHIHTGLDCMPKNVNEPVDVFAMASGVVCSIHLDAQFLTVVVRHILPTGQTIFTSYKHLGESFVSIGDIFNKDTKIARVLTKREARTYRGAYDHLHLEVRYNFLDYGCASWLTMTKSELNSRFIDPLKFIKEKVK